VKIGKKNILKLPPWVCGPLFGLTFEGTNRKSPANDSLLQLYSLSCAIVIAMRHQKGRDVVLGSRTRS